MGIVIINVLPFSTSLTTEILPLCSSINPLAIYKPNIKIIKIINKDTL